MARKRKRVFIDPSKLVYDPLYYDNKEDNESNADTEDNTTETSQTNDIKSGGKDAASMHGAAGPDPGVNGGQEAGQKHRLTNDDESAETNAVINSSTPRRKLNTEPSTNPNEPNHDRPNASHSGSIKPELDKRGRPVRVSPTPRNPGVLKVQKQSRLGRPDVVSRGPAAAKTRDNEQRERRGQPVHSREDAGRAQQEINAQTSLPAPQPPVIPSSELTQEEIELILLSSEEEEVIDLLSSEESDFGSLLVTSQTSNGPPPPTQPNTSQSAVNPSLPAGLNPQTSSKPLPPTCTLHIHCIIPHKEERTDMQWPRVKSFYDFESLFGESAVIFFKDHEVKRFSSPAIQAPTQTELDLIICTREQFYKVKMGEINAQSIISGTASTESAETEPPQTESAAFPITLEGKHGTVRVQVHLETKLSAVADHYKREKNLTDELRFKFDGDELGLNSTVGDAELEEDDKLEVYVVGRT